MSEGYVVIAFDDGRYLDIAANLALSVRRVDTRPVSVLVNAPVAVDPAYRPLFDQVITVDDDPAIKGAMNKVRLFDLSPYDRTMYLDADCLMFNSRVEFFWRRYRGHPFAVEGHRQSKGPVFACSLGQKDAAALCALLNVPFISVFNAGVIHFERTPESRAVFDQALALYRGPLRDALTYSYKHAGEYADEPIFGAAMALLGIAPFETPPLQRLQVTTPNLVEGVMDLDVGELQLIKRPPGGKPQAWSGSVGHFCGLSPMDTYFALADKLRRGAGLPPMDRSLFRPVVLTATAHQENVA